MWLLELGMRYIDGYPYYPILDMMVIFIAILICVCLYYRYENRKQKEKIEELENLVDYYYHEDLLK